MRTQFWSDGGNGILLSASPHGAQKGKGRGSMAKFRKKPVIIEAIQIDGSHDGVQRVIDWVNASNPQFNASDSATWTISSYYGEVKIRTLEGEMTAQKGDWIIKGIAGEFYPCKPDIFAATYEPVD